MNVCIIDNYDSFTYNLYQFIGEILSGGSADLNGSPHRIDVYRNDEIGVAELAKLEPDRIIISPGPGSPDDPAYFGVCADVIRELGAKIPLLGVCLGMQGIVHGFGGRIVKASLPMHGKISPIAHDGKGVFDGLPQNLEVMRYHSLIAASESIPDCLQLTAVVSDGAPAAALPDDISKPGDAREIMAVRHRELPITGIQFHPESFATEAGRELIANFLRQA